MKCESCSADISPESIQCDFCGSYAVRNTTVRAEPPPLSRSETFARIKTSPEYLAAARGKDLGPQAYPSALLASNVSTVVFSAAMVIGTILTGGMLRAAWPNVTMPLGLLFLFMLALLALGCYGTARVYKTTYSYFTSPAQPTPAIVSSKRVASSGQRGGDRSYFATLRYENGERKEVRIWDAELFQRLAKEDAGFAIQRGEVVLGFRLATL